VFLEKQSGRKIKVLRTDNGREYINHEFKELIRSESIRHQTIVPYNPQQNGLAERANRTVIERSRTIQKWIKNIGQKRHLPQYI